MSCGHVNLTRKANFFEGCCWFKFNNLGLTLYGLEILHQCGKRVKTKSHKVLGANSYVCRSYSGKTSRGGGLFAILNRVKQKEKRCSEKTGCNIRDFKSIQDLSNLYQDIE